MPTDKSLDQLIREYEATVKRLPATLEGYSAIGQDARDQIRDEARELHLQILYKRRDSHHLTWFGVKV